MDERPPGPEIFRFGLFVLDAESLELSRSGQRLPLRPQPAKLLALLVRNAGQVVSREAIRRDVWGDDTVVEFDQGVNTCIRQIRSALRDDAHSPTFIETVPKRGYRFLAEVHRLRAPSIYSPEDARESRPGVAIGSDVARSRRWTWAVLVLLGLVALAVWAWSKRTPMPLDLEGQIRLAVLPFENLSGDASRDYFSDGLTEELIFQLSRLRPDRVAVIARTSVVGYQGTQRTIAEIGNELDVDFILEGSVRHDANRVRVTAQLIRVQDESHVWSETYERDLQSLFALHGDISTRVAKSLALELLVPEIAAQRRGYTTNSTAYDLYLRGRHQWNRFDGNGMRRARVSLERALALDSTFALAWAALADVYNLLPYYDDIELAKAASRAKECARRALSLDDQTAAAHNALAFALFYYDRDWQAANESFERALELEPGYAMAHHWYAGLLSALGRHDEAIQHNRLAVELDPLSLSVRSDLAWYYLFARRYQEAADEARRALAQEPYHSWSHSGLILALYKQRDYDAALQELRNKLERHGGSTAELDSLATRPAQKCIEDHWRVRLERSKARGFSTERDAYGYAVQHAMIGKIDEAIEALEIAMDQHDPWVVFAAVDPRLDRLRDQPRFAHLLAKLGLDDEASRDGSS